MNYFPLPLDLCLQPVFIIGSPRSGTTALAWSLAQHDALWTSGESDVLFHLFAGGRVDQIFREAKARPHGWFRDEDVQLAEFQQALGLGLNALFSRHGKGKRWVDQTPLYTLMVDELAAMFPDALFLHILRDGRRVVHSMINFLASRDAQLTARLRSGPFLAPWINDFERACEAWQRYVRIALDFTARYPDRCLTVVNEQLVADPEAGFGDILRFLQVSYQPAPAQYFQTHRVNSSFQVDTANAMRQARPDPWEVWTPAQRAVFLHVAGSTMVRAGLITDSELSSLSHDAAPAIAGDSQPEMIRRVVGEMLPATATILVVSKGDDALLQLGGRNAWHFPRSDDGGYTGYHPSSADEAIGHLERWRGEGAQFLLFPPTSFWWLDHYRPFTRYLEQRYTCIRRDGTSIIFSLAGSPLDVTGVSSRAEYA